MKKKTRNILNERDAQVVLMRHDNGYTFERIAQEMGYASPGGAYEAYKRGVARAVVDTPKEAKMADLRRIDKIIEALMTELQNGNLKVIDPLLRTLDRKSKYLGLDTPIRIQQEVTTWEGGDTIDRAVQDLANLLRANAENSASESAVAGDTGSPESITAE